MCKGNLRSVSFIDSRMQFSLYRKNSFNRVGKRRSWIDVRLGVGWKWNERVSYYSGNQGWGKLGDVVLVENRGWGGSFRSDSEFGGEISHSGLAELQKFIMYASINSRSNYLTFSRIFSPELSNVLSLDFFYSFYFLSMCFQISDIFLYIGSLICPLVKWFQVRVVGFECITLIRCFRGFFFLECRQIILYKTYFYPKI